MAGTSVHDYLVDHSAFDWPRLLTEWAWLLPPKLTVWLMNRFGDLFLILEDGSVHLLDVGGGSLTRLAEGREDFCRQVDEGDNANQWLMIPLVDRVVAAGLGLEPGQCYGYKIPPVLGGGYTVENTVVLPVAEHIGFCGSLHHQIADVPDGGQVVLRVGDDPEH
jgi:hypothetical protein